MNPSEQIVQHIATHRQVVKTTLKKRHDVIDKVARVLATALDGGHKVVAFGNGGSAAQASHFAGELLGRFGQTRKPLPAIALSADPATTTCISNDFSFEAVFERQVEGLVQPYDVVLGLTTSGQSANVRRGLEKAQALDAITVALTGSNGLADASVDYEVAVPSTSTAHVQEVHLVLLHIWCACIDEAVNEAETS